MAKIGYARVSTRDQNLDRQIESLEKIKVDKLF
ncbi:MAG: recombinase family protein, partial [Lactobacillus sp.]|nr:recombinase family protein [Lactobacillus sp.]